VGEAGADEGIPVAVEDAEAQVKESEESFALVGLRAPAV